jgi:hypothetical protein
MHDSLKQAFREGADCAVLTGSDIPGLTSTLVTEAFKALKKHPIVIGPASDGGYYLIGMRAPGVQLFTNIAWSTNQVLIQTIEHADAQGVKLKYLPTLSDLDDGVEYETWLRNIKMN